MGKKKIECRSCGAVHTIEENVNVKALRCCPSPDHILLSTELDDKENKELERLKALQKEGKLWDYCIEEIGKKHSGNIAGKEMVFLSCLGRLVKNKKPFSFNLILHSESSSGKDHLVESVLMLFPSSDIEAYGRISKTFLSYLHDKKKEPLFSYDGKILYLEEISPEILNNEVMKVFTSGLTKSGITKDQKAEVIEVEGKPVVIVTTATTKPTPEILNRFSIVNLDVTEEHRRRAYLLEEEEYNPALKHLLNELELLNVNIPANMKKKIARIFPADKVKYMRSFPRFLDIVKAIVVFNQNFRAKSKGEIIATWEDYDLAVSIFRNYRSGVSSIPLRYEDKKIVEILKKSTDGDNNPIPLTAKEILQGIDGGVQSNVYRHLAHLVENEILEALDKRDNFQNPIKMYQLSEDMKDINPIKLLLHDDFP